MSDKSATLHLFCGKIAAGKSTLAARLAEYERAVLIAEDDWLSTLFGAEMKTVKDYVRCAAKLREIMGPHIVTLLNAGTSVVLDFPANTVQSRVWMRGILNETGADHQCHVLTPPDDVCLARLRQRNASGVHPFAVTEAQFYQISKHFVPPTADEGFTLVIHDQVQ